MITDREIEELEKLLKIDIVHRGLTEFNELTNPNYKFLFKAISEQRFGKDGKLASGYRGVALEGSSRSGKTWSGVDVIIWLCTHIEENCSINIYRETYNEFKTTLYEDFKRRLDDFGIQNPFHRAKEVKSFKIGNNTISFLGDGKEGGGCDYAFFNEIMQQERKVFDHVEMRCRKFWWADYNPSFTDHWFFNNVLTRPDVGFLRTSFNQNPYITNQERNKILSYEPWEPRSYVVSGSGDLSFNGKPIDDRNQPPPHIENINNGTADEFMWKVYGLGLRGAMKGVIFEHVTWIDEFPDMAYIYANDFGFTADPNVLGRYAEDERNIYCEVLSYQPIETDEDLSNFMEAIGVEKTIPIACDSSDKYTGENKGTVEMVKGLRKRGWRAFKISKTKSIMYWILSMKTKKIHFVKNRFYQQIKIEKENYRFKEIGGVMINQPNDAYNHIWDFARYGHIAHNSQKTTVYETEKSVLKSMNY